jgi:hypothetical protein
VAGRKTTSQPSRGWSTLTRPSPKMPSENPGEEASWLLDKWKSVKKMIEGIQCTLDTEECLKKKLKEQAKERSPLKEYEKPVKEFGEKMEPSVWEMCKELLGRQGTGGKINDALSGQDDSNDPVPSTKPRPSDSKKLRTYQE